jgi:signal transduction histidine kinase
MAALDSFMERIRRIPPFALDAALALAVVLVIVLDLARWLPARDPGAHAKALDYVLMSVSGAALAFRHRKLWAAWAVSRLAAIPLLAHLVYIDDIGTHILAVLILFAIAEQCSRPVAVAGLAAEYGLVVSTAFLVVPTPGTAVFQTFFYFGFLFGFVWLAGRAQRYRKRLTGQLLAQTTALREEQERLAAQAVAAERRRIARDLHSLVIQGVEQMATETRSARKELALDPRRARKAIEAIEGTGRRTLAEMGGVLALIDPIVGANSESKIEPRQGVKV